MQLGVNSWDLSHDDVPYDDFFVGEEMNDIGVGDATDVTEEAVQMLLPRSRRK